MPKTGDIESNEPVAGESVQGAPARCVWRRQANSDGRQFPPFSILNFPFDLFAADRPQNDRPDSSLYSGLGVTPMLIESQNSNCSEWPLGTGCSALHGMRLVGWWCRSAFGQQGTAHGNRRSTIQGGIRTPFGFLPFKLPKSWVHSMCTARNHSFFGASRISVDPTKTAGLIPVSSFSGVSS